MSPANTISTTASDIRLEKTAQATANSVTVSAQSQNPSRQPSPGPNNFSARPPNFRNATTTSLQSENFTKPRDPEHHSRIPYFLQLSGSITPRMIVPLLFVGCWSTLITCISKFVYPLVVDSVLLTVLGFVVGLGISFRTSSAYERYVDGRKYWMQLSQASRDLARHLWIHIDERHLENPQLGKEDLLGKVAALNLVNAFAQALKHRLRFEPYSHYEDLDPLVSHLSTFASAASSDNPPAIKKKSHLKKIGEYLGITFAASNPRKLIKRSTKQLGNLPLEILTYLSAYHASVIKQGTIDATYQGAIAANIASLNEVLAGTERVLNTPLPIAYSIAISQITWVYVIALPFQLFKTLKWMTIPGTIVGAYIILGIAAIGREIENPFGFDDNDLPLENFCNQLSREIDVIRSKPAPRPEDFFKREDNRLLFSTSYPTWKERSVEEIRKGLSAKAEEVVRTNKEKKGWKGVVPQGDP